MRRSVFFLKFGHEREETSAGGGRAGKGLARAATQDHATHELDLVVRGTIDGRQVMIVCEVKSAVTAKEVERFMKVIGWLRVAHPDQDIRGPRG